MGGTIPKGIRDKIKAYVTLIRPIGWMPFLFPLLLGLIDSGFSSLTTVYLMLLIYGPLLPGGIYILNFYADIAADRQSHVVKDLSMAQQPFVTGRVGKLGGLSLAVALIIAGLALAWTVNPMVFLFGLLAVAIGTVYSFPPRLKNIPFGDAAANSLVAAICYIAGWVTFGHIAQLPIYPAVWIFLLIASTYLLTVLIDLESDKQAGLNTTAVYLGVDKAVTLGFYTYVISLVFYFIVLVSRFNFAYLLIAPGLARGLFSYYKRWQAKDPTAIYSLARKATITSVVAVVTLLLIYTSFNILGTSDKEILKSLWGGT